MSVPSIRPTNQVQEQEFTKEQLELIKATVAKGATDNELKLFLYRCKIMGLDPLKPGMVHFVKYGSSPGTIIVGIEGFRSKAARTGKLTGIKRGVVRNAEGVCVGGWCEVYRSDWQHPAREEVSLAEYNTGKSQWAKMPETMIKKVAEAAALRMAFADELGGVFAEEEMQQAASVDARAKEIEKKIEQTEATPEFEDHFDFEEPPPADETLGDFVFTVGKKHKGKKLKDISLKDLQSFVEWADETARSAKGIHPDVMKMRDKCEEYLRELESAE